jgi:two-component system response regulator NreC
VDTATAQRKAVTGAAKTVLVADDNPLIRGLLRELFLFEEFSFCVEAGTGLEAIQVARKSRPTLIVLDISMPDMTGLEAAPLLKKILPETTIILFTLFGDHLRDLDLTSVGVSATFAKSDPLDQLLHKAQELLEK